MMKVLTKCRDYKNFLVYLLDDNDNSLECYEITGEDAIEKRNEKENELMSKYGLTRENDYHLMTIDEFMRQEYKEYKLDNGEYNSNGEYPLILVFYLDRELMENKQILLPYAQSVNDGIAARKANIMVYFIPTDGEERIECINPKQVSPADMGKINAMTQEIAKQFNVGDITLNEE